MIRTVGWEEMARRGSGALPFLNQLEGFARQLLARVSMENRLRVEILRVLAELPLEVVERTPKGALGWTVGNTIYIDPYQTAQEQDATVAREVCRWLLTKQGIRVAKQDLLLEQLALCVLAPQGGIRRLISKAGGFAWAIHGLLYSQRDLASPTHLLIRAALCSDVGLVLFPARGGGPLTVAAGTFQERNVRLSSVDPARVRDWLQKAKDCRHAIPGPPGVCVVSYRDGDRRGAAFVSESAVRPDTKEDEFSEALAFGEAWNHGIDPTPPPRPPPAPTPGDYP